jgi:hypothetical protein
VGKLLKAIVFGIGFLFVVVQQWHVSVDERRARHWPSVEGHIVEADAVQIGSRTGSPGWGPNLRYEYSVEGRVHASAQIAIDGVGHYAEWNFDNMVAAMRARGWQPGATVTVYYDPRDESNAVLDPMRNPWLPMLYAATFLVLFGVAVQYGIRAVKEGPVP